MAQAYRIVAPRFVAGVVVEDGIVVATAPILCRFYRKPLVYVRHYCRSRRWQLEAV